MSDAAALEKQAADLRDCARRARTTAQGLATYLDPIVTSAKDDTLWKGPYPTQATGDLGDYAQRLTSAAHVLEADAKAWDAKAGSLEDDAADARAAAKAAEAAKDKTPVGAK